MNDKTMLEWAAKAAGVEFDDYDEEQKCLFKNHQTSYGPGRSFWDPLNYDADALRLAVKLHMMIDHVSRGYKAGHVAAVADKGSCYEPSEPDAMAATRRAITRAAAEIGKAMGRG